MGEEPTEKNTTTRVMQKKTLPKELNEKRVKQTVSHDKTKFFPLSVQIHNVNCELRPRFHFYQDKVYNLDDTLMENTHGAILWN